MPHRPVTSVSRHQGRDHEQANPDPRSHAGAAPRAGRMRQRRGPEQRAGSQCRGERTRHRGVIGTVGGIRALGGRTGRGDAEPRPQLPGGPAPGRVRRERHQGRGRGSRRRPDHRDLRGQRARRRCGPHPVGDRRRHRHGHPGRLRAECRLCSDERGGRCLRLRRQRAPVQLLHQRRIGGAHRGLRGRDRRPHPRRLEHRGAPIHRKRAHSHAGRPGRTADALPAVADLPAERRGDGRRGRRGGVRGALPRAPAGHRGRAGEPDHQHRRDQSRRGAGLHQPLEPPAELQPGHHRRGLERAQHGAAGRAVGRRRRGDGPGAGVRRGSRGGDPRGLA